MKSCSYSVVLPCHPAIRFKDKSERSVLLFCLCTHCCRSERSVPLLPLYASLQSFVARSALVPLQSVAIPETALSVDSLLLCHYKQIVIQPVHASFPFLLFLARVQLVRHQLVGHSRSHQPPQRRRRPHLDKTTQPGRVKRNTQSSAWRCTDQLRNTTTTNNDPRDTTQHTTREPKQHAKTQQQTSRNDDNHDGSEEHTLADKRRAHPRAERPF